MHIWHEAILIQVIQPVIGSLAHPVNCVAPVSQFVFQTFVVTVVLVSLVDRLIAHKLLVGGQVACAFVQRGVAGFGVVVVAEPFK